MTIDFNSIPDPVFLRGDERLAYRDPAAHYHDGVFRVFHTQVHDEDGTFYTYLAVCESRDLIRWSKPRLLTPRDQSLNYSSPGNVIRFRDRWLLCLQTYPTPQNQMCADDSARIFVMESRDLEQWSEPRLLRVKGAEVAIGDMGRMIDPYFVRDKEDEECWYCFYKQNGASLSMTRDFENWEFIGRVEAGENACVLVEGDEYLLFHSPENGIGLKTSADLRTWRDLDHFVLGQETWPWSQGRLTAGQVLDLTHVPGIDRYLMFFHGADREGCRTRETHGHASLALAWSTDLRCWDWPGKSGV